MGFPAHTVESSLRGKNVRRFLALTSLGTLPAALHLAHGPRLCACGIFRDLRASRDSTLAKAKSRSQDSP